MTKAASYIKCSAAGLIAISRGTLAGYKVFTRLAPGEWFDSVFYEAYCGHHFTQIARLDAPK